MSDQLARISDVEAVEVARVVRPLTEINERECVARLASEVLPGGQIVEIGCLYGGMTAVMGLANPDVRIVSIDDFSWHPADDVETSKLLLMTNMAKVGVKNVSCIEGDSRVIGKTWGQVGSEVSQHIDLLWIDGGHSFDYVYADLSNFGPFADVIAVHDYDNPHWTSIRQAVERFLREHEEWAIDEVVGTVCVLRKS
jgi:precorrin-6B methylase 2